MKQLVFYISEDHELKNWYKSFKGEPKIIPSINEVINFDKMEFILLAQCNLSKDAKDLENIVNDGYKVILFSNVPNNDEAIYWFQKGIKGYLNTFANSERIAQAVETVLAGNIWLGQNTMQALISAAQPLSSANSSWKNIVTAREQETLEHLLTGKSNKQIALKMAISERTVKSFISKLLEKFSVTDRLALVLAIHNWQGSNKNG